MAPVDSLASACFALCSLACLLALLFDASLLCMFDVSCEVPVLSASMSISDSNSAALTHTQAQQRRGQ